VAYKKGETYLLIDSGTQTHLQKLKDNKLINNCLPSLIKSKGSLL